MNFSEALLHAREHTAIVQRMEFALQDNPANEKLVLGLGSARRRAKRSQETLESFADGSQIDLIRYRLERGSEIYAIEAVADSVRAFQKSFTGAADFLENGPKAKAKYSKDIEDRTRLNFAYTFPGSLGIVLAVENKRENLFGEGDFDSVVDVFHQFLSVSDENEAIDASRTLGAGLISQLCWWVDVNSKWETSVDLIVRRPNGIMRGEFVSYNRFFDLHDIFHAATDKEPSTYDVNGMLVGLDIELGSFHFVVPGGDDYRGSLDDGFHKQATTVGNRYIATIHETVSRVVATGKESRLLKLKSLEPINEGSRPRSEI